MLAISNWLVVHLLSLVLVVQAVRRGGIGEDSFHSMLQKMMHLGTMLLPAGVIDSETAVTQLPVFEPRPRCIVI